MKRIFAAVVFALVLCGAKASFGDDFKEAGLSQLEVGSTTLPQAVALLGVPPAQSVTGKSGALGHIWMRAEGKSSLWTGKVSSSAKSVTLVFNTDGTFQRILQIQGITLSEADLKRLMADPAAERTASAP